MIYAYLIRRVRGSGYNARTGNNEAICPGGAKKQTKKIQFKYYKWIFTFDFPVLYSPNEPVNFLGFFTFLFRIRICPCGSGSGRPFLMWIRIRNTGFYARN